MEWNALGWKGQERNERSEQNGRHERNTQQDCDWKERIAQNEGRIGMTAKRTEWND